MSRHQIATRDTTPTPRVVYYSQPVTRPAAVSVYHPAEVARRRAYAVAVREWQARQDAIHERDRKVRQFLFGLGAAVGLTFVTAIAVGGWIVYQAATHAGTWLAANAALIVVGAIIGLPLLVVGGHRCITTVIHRH
jgi:hypothetical protein